jgi:hypothetical protein
MTSPTTDDDIRASRYATMPTMLRLASSIFPLVTFLFYLAFVKTRTTFREARRRRRTARDDGGRHDERNYENDDDQDAFVVGFFHPRCSSGGGGERVLWKSIQALGELREGGGGGGRTSSGTTDERKKTKNVGKLSVVVYTIDEPSDDYHDRIMDDVARRFNIIVPGSLPVRFVHLHEYKAYLGE